MHTDQIYIARDGKSGMHVLVRILAVDDIGKDYLPIDPDDFNKLMMARDVRSLVLAARDLGPMHISADILPHRIFVPSHLRQHIEHGVNIPPEAIAHVLMETRSHAALPPMTPRLRFQVWVKGITPPSSSITSFPISRRAISPTDGLNAPASEAAPDLSPKNSAPTPLCLSQGYKARTSIAR